MADSPKDAKAIFLAALEIADTAERVAFVERSCGGDAALRLRVEDLLRAYGQPSGPLEKLAAALATTEMAEPIGERVGDVVAGRYKLVEALGEGGMGAVFMAQQTQPVKRVVALKLIKLGMDSKQVLARFEAERQALALMDHPNIAKVLDAGTTDSGRPFFVMELVKGVPITRFCDERQLSPRQRLELFIPVCQAIQHAHQKGIIHRDIKPTNVLVALYDDRPVPKVIDFGVAKAAGLQLTDASLVTGFGAIVGTPEYMSPEQAQLNQLDIDTRSDVYALGVLLYELLTGTTPIDRKRLGQGALFEVLRIIREEEPPRPSTRLSTSDALASIAATRATEPSKLARLMRGELDWIVMKCLEKDRSRRYESANGLAHDLERYLADEPVEACPPSSTYRLRKFAGRYKKLLATAAAFVVLLAVAAVTSTMLAVWATSAQREANRQRTASDQASQEALYAKQAAMDAKAEADRQRDEARLTAYASGMQLAQRAWEENNVVRARELLEEVPKEGIGGKLRGFEWHYLYRLCHSEALTIRVDGVNMVTFSPDGRRLASACRDSTVKIWESATGKELFRLKGHLDQVESVAFSPDGHSIVSGSPDKTVRVWDSATGREQVILRRDAPALGTAANVVFSPDGQRLASADYNNPLKISDRTTGKELLSLRNAGVVVAFSPDGRRLATGSSNKTVKIWDSATGKELLDLKGDDIGGVWCVAFSPDGKRLAAGSDVVKIWDTASGKELLEMGNKRSVWCMAFSPDGQRLATGSDDTTVTIWDSSTGRALFSLKGHSEQVRCLAFSPDGERLASVSDDGTVKIWDTAIGNDQFEFVRSYLEFKNRVWLSRTVSFSSDGQRLAAGPWLGHIAVVWDSTTGQKLLSLDGNTDSNMRIAFSPDGRRVATAGFLVKIWDIATRKELFSLNGAPKEHTDRYGHSWFPTFFRSVAFSPDGQRLAIGGEQLKIVDLASGKGLLTLNGLDGVIENLAFSPDGRWLATCTILPNNKGKVSVWETATGKEQYSLKGHEKLVRSLVFSPDGQCLATGSDDLTAKIWDIATGTERLSLKGHSAAITGVAFSPDGQRLVTAGPDGVKIWHSATGKELFALKGQGFGYDSVAFSPDGQRLAAFDGRGAVHLWETNVSPRALHQRAITQMVASLFDRLTLRADVLERLGATPGVSPLQKQEAINVTLVFPEDPSALNELAWSAVSVPGRAMPAYRHALRYIEEGSRLEPDDGLLLNTLGVAYYRVGDYDKALETLLRSDRINKVQNQGSLPVDLAFLAMTQQQLGHAKEAQAELERLRERMKKPIWANYEDARNFLREAEALLAEPKTPAGKQSAVAKP